MLLFAIVGAFVTIQVATGSQSLTEKIVPVLMGLALLGCSTYVLTSMLTERIVIENGALFRYEIGGRLAYIEKVDHVIRVSWESGFTMPGAILHFEDERQLKLLGFPAQEEIVAKVKECNPYVIIDP